MYLQKKMYKKIPEIVFQKHFNSHMDGNGKIFEKIQINSD